MKLGICSMWGTSVDLFRSEVRLAADMGFDLVTVGDSPSGWHEMVASMTIAALEAPGAQIGSLVTSPFMRHPLVAANAFATLDELTGGRAVMGFATGGSTVLAIGRPPATQALRPCGDCWPARKSSGKAARSNRCASRARCRSIIRPSVPRRWNWQRRKLTGSSCLQATSTSKRSRRGLPCCVMRQPKLGVNQLHLGATPARAGDRRSQGFYRSQCHGLAHAAGAGHVAR